MQFHKSIGTNYEKKLKKRAASIFAPGLVYYPLHILGGCCLAIKNHYLKEMFDFCPYTYHDNWLSYCMLALGDAVAINKSLFAYRLHGNNTVGCNNLLSNRKGIYKNFIKFKNRVKNCKKIYVDEVERAIYLKNFADKHNVTNRALDYQQNLVRKK